MNYTHDHTEEKMNIQSKSFVVCKHCGKLVDQVKLIGFSLICPMCGKPQNGHQKDNAQTSNDQNIICKHCGKLIEKAKLLGISLICPICGKPQNGHGHGDK